MTEQPLSVPTAAVVLAAGKGTRMKSALPKVLHKIANRSMLEHVLRTAESVGCAPLVTVAGPDMPKVEELGARFGATCIQQKQLGTGDAVLAAQDTLADFKGHVLVLYGDTPLITKETLLAMLHTLNDTNVAACVLGFTPNDAGAYGRLVLAEDGSLERIVEAKDATKKELEIGFCNSGVMALNGNCVWSLLTEIEDNNAAGEYYLTDVVGIARAKGMKCVAVHGDAEEVLGVNSRVELAQAENILQNRLREAAMVNGATLIDPATTYFSADTQLGKDVVVQPNVFFGPEVTVGNKVEIRAFSHIEGTVIANGATVGPFVRLRPGAGIGEDVKVGNFVEIKKAQLERGAKVSHLSYIGDAHVGENANIGAGTITCNYDGFNKHHTEIGREAFIGSNTALVAPVVVGAGAIVGAGSVVTENVDADALALTRPGQTTKSQWAKAFREKQEKEG